MTYESAKVRQTQEYKNLLKRIDSWKAKAIARREEAEMWKARYTKLEQAPKIAGEKVNKLTEENKALKIQFEALERSFTKLRFENERLKKKPIGNQIENKGSEIKPKHHRYSLRMMRTSFDLYREAFGFKEIARILKVTNFECKTPCADTIKQWIIKYSYKSLHAPIESANNWAILADSTATIGQQKALVILGVQMDKILNRNDLTLKYTDVKVLSIYISKTINGKIVCDVVKKALERIGNKTTSFISDQGSDLKKAGKLLQETRSDIKCIYDIPHKMALLIERELKNSTKWKRFLSDIGKTSVSIAQTELSAIKPPKQRIKARYMNANIFIEWYIKTFEMISLGRLIEIGIEKERFEKYFDWFFGYEEYIYNCEKMFFAVNIINDEVRTNGVSKNSCNNITKRFVLAGIQNNSFSKKALNAVLEEVEKLDNGQIVFGSTEILESFIGKYKHHGVTAGQGINSHALGMANLAGDRPDFNSIKDAMEAYTNKTASEWVKEMIGKGLGKLRYQFYRASYKNGHVDEVRKTA